MKFAVVAFLLACVAPPAFAADWVYVGDNDSGTLFGDASSLRMQGQLATAWFKLDYAVAQSLGKDSGSKIRFDQQRVLYQADCAAGVGAIRKVAVYGAHGTKQLHVYDYRSAEMEQPIPDTGLEDLQTAVCSALRHAKQEMGSPKEK